MKDIKIAALLGVVFLATACSEGFKGAHPQVIKDGPQGSEGIVGGVIKARAELPVMVDSSGRIHVQVAADVPINVVNPANTRFGLDTTSMVNPTASNAMLDFGVLKISELFDNGLRVCGATQNVKCTKAFIQIYTKDMPGAGLYNVADGYGMPFYGNRVGETPLLIGLNAANAAVVHMINIPNNKNVIRLQDFANANFQLTSDFTEAGAGSYAATAVIEFGLMD